MLPTVDLLLQVGADANAGGDFNGNAPLHYLAVFNPYDELVARLLLASGAHLDRVNQERKTAVNLWKEEHARHELDEVEMNQLLPSWLREVPALKCLAASVISSHRVPFLESPQVLHPFVKEH